MVRGASYDGEEVRFPLGASTRTRLHEFAHQELGHIPGTYTAEELARYEVDAEALAWEWMDKRLTPRVGIPAMSALLERAPDLTTREVLNTVIDALRVRGVTVTRSGREELKYFLEECRWD